MISAGQQRLAFEPLGDSAWRLCDHASDEDSAERLVAYVEQIASGGFEAIWIGLGVRRSVHSNREEIRARARALRTQPPARTGSGSEQTSTSPRQILSRDTHRADSTRPRTCIALSGRQRHWRRDGRKSGLRQSASVLVSPRQFRSDAQGALEPPARSGQARSPALLRDRNEPGPHPQRPGPETPVSGETVL